MRPLFWAQPISDYVTMMESAALLKVDRIDPNEFLRLSIDDLDECVLENYSLQLPTIEWGALKKKGPLQASIDAHTHPQVASFGDGSSSVDGLMMLYTVPFTGGGQIFNLRPSRLPGKQPFGRVDGNDLVFEYVYPKQSFDQALIENRFICDRNGISSFLVEVGHEIDDYNRSLQRKVRDALLVRRRNLTQQLNWPDDVFCFLETPTGVAGDAVPATIPSELAKKDHCPNNWQPSAGLGNKPINPVQVFFSYSHSDEEFREKLEKHFSALQKQGAIVGWHDRKIVPGTDWSAKISEHLSGAAVVLLLISADFIASDYCYGNELKEALARHERGLARVIPVIVRPCDWKSVPGLATLQAVPKDGIAITKWANQDEALTDVVEGVKRVLGEID